jgi:Globin
MLQHVKYQLLSLVIESWEAAKQRHSCAEKIGMAILIELFRSDSSAKNVFGFAAKSVEDIETRPLLLMGLLLHGRNLMMVFDTVLGLLGPDVDGVEEILRQNARTLVQLGVKPNHFGSLNVAVRHALKNTMGSSYSNAVDEAWNQVLREVSKSLIRSMGHSKRQLVRAG